MLLQTDELQAARVQLSQSTSEGARLEALLAASHQQQTTVVQAQQAVFLQQFCRHRQQVLRLRAVANEQRVTLLTTLRAERRQTSDLIQRKDEWSHQQLNALQTQLNEAETECVRLQQEIVLMARQADTERLVTEERLAELRREADAAQQRVRREQKRCQAAEGKFA